MNLEEREMEESRKVDPERKESVKGEEFLERFPKRLTVSFSGSILHNGFFSPFVCHL